MKNKIIQINTTITEIITVYISNGINLIMNHHMRNGIQIMTGIADTLYNTQMTVTIVAPNNIIMNSNGLLRMAIALVTKPITGTHLKANKYERSRSNTSLRCLNNVCNLSITLSTIVLTHFIMVRMFPTIL